jgi:hypothetical protein
LQTFWNAIHTNPGQFGSSSAEAAYVVPANFGFGFRAADDHIWGLFPASNDPQTAKIWNYTQLLLTRYNYRLNIIYDNQTVIGPTLNEYAKVYYYNQTIKWFLSRTIFFHKNILNVNYLANSLLYYNFWKSFSAIFFWL